MQEMMKNQGKMSLDGFVKVIQMDMKKKLGESYNIQIQEVIKNNDLKLTGLSILKTGERISPTIYLDSYFKEYLDGRELEEIEKDILKVYEENKPVSQVFDVELFTDYEQVKSKIMFKLVGLESNKELLTDVPYVRCLDMAIVFYVLFSKDENGLATSLLHNSHLEMWNVTVDDIYEISKKNTVAALPGTIQSMGSVLSQFATDLDSEEFEAEMADSTMFVITNQSKINGASCILYDNLLKQFADKMESDVFIIPSSTCECLLVPLYLRSSVYNFNHNNSFLL